MITFLTCLLLLIGSYFFYGKIIERIFGIDSNHKMPSQTHYDGIDFVPMPKWKTFLIQLLNIAGLGPIFGAVLGASYGTVAFLWITLGGILIGGIHDFASGYISVKMNGLSYPEIIGKYLGNNIKQVARVFIVLLMILVGAVFMVGPAGILHNLVGLDTWIWVWIILIYYLVATVLPINKIIGRIYPLFGFALLFMAAGLLISIFINNHHIPELTLQNLKTSSENFPIFPTLFITIACGAISGFHATQSPMMARCITNENQIKPVFFGAMIAESLIALIWAAIAIVFFDGVAGLNLALVENGNNAARIVDIIANTELGRIGGILALLGVVAAPISTGDTAFRSARLIIADFLNISQKVLIKRILISVPLFVVGYGITLINFDILWRYFAFINQTLAAVTLWTTFVYLVMVKKNYHVALYPAIFMTFIVTQYFFVSKQLLGIPYNIGTIMAMAITILITLYFIFVKLKNKITNCQI